MRLGLEKGVWFNGASALLAGAGALTGGTTFGLPQYVGFVGMVLGLSLLAWGITFDGVQWWKREQIGVTWPFALMAVSIVGLSISLWGAYRSPKEPMVRPPVSRNTTPSTLPSSSLVTETITAQNRTTAHAQIIPSVKPSPEQPMASSLSDILDLRCSHGAIPSFVPPDGGYDVVHLSPDWNIEPPFFMARIGFKQAPGTTLPDFSSDGPDPAVVCTLTNYSDKPLYDFKVPMEVSYYQIIKTEAPGRSEATGGALIKTAKANIIIDKIEPGAGLSKTFYVSLVGRAFAVGVVSSIFSVKLADGSVASGEFIKSARKGDRVLQFVPPARAYK